MIQPNKDGIGSNLNSTDFDKFLKSCVGVSKRHNLAYVFWYKEVYCFGRITIDQRHIFLDILPINIKDDIGNGYGMIVSKIFDRE